MRILWAALLLALVGAALYLREDEPSGAFDAGASAASESESRFVAMPPLAGVSPDSAIIFAPKNCPSDAAQRAATLARALSDNGIPVVRLDHAEFEFEQAPDAELLSRINSVMGGGIPVVFIKGRARSNPTLAEVLDEYSAERPIH